MMNIKRKAAKTEDDSHKLTIVAGQISFDFMACFPGRSSGCSVRENTQSFVRLNLKSGIRMS